MSIKQLGEVCIAWLPFRKESEDGIIKCIRDSCRFNNELDEESYNHPVSILRKEILAEYKGSLIEIQGHDRGSIYVPFPMLGLPMGFVDEVKWRDARFLVTRQCLKFPALQPPP